MLSALLLTCSQPSIGLTASSSLDPSSRNFGSTMATGLIIAFFQKAASLSSYSLPLECSFVIFIRHKMDSWLRFWGVKCSERTINGFIGSEDFKYKIGPPSV